MDENYEIPADSEGAFAGLFAGIGLIYLAIILLLIISCWKVFTKAGKPGWAAIIPVYNGFVLLSIVGRPWWWLLLMLIPLVNIVIGIIVNMDLAKSFGKEAVYGLGLAFLPFIFLPMLAFSSASYIGPSAK